MAMIEVDDIILVKPRRLITIMNLLTDGPLPVNYFIPHEETIKAKRCGVDLGFLKVDPNKNIVYLTSEGYSWLLRNDKVL